jgi:dienelactone hydrolase
VRLALLGVASGLLLAATARAQDACLSEVTLLADERALTALRSAVEGACPCASFTGGRGLGRRAYRRCARGVIDAAVAAGDLRAECEDVAWATVKGAVCGTAKVACGRFQESKPEPVSCRVKPVARCTDRARFEQTACAGQSHCADVVEWTASTCVDPRTGGPFAAGRRTVVFTKPSAIDPNQDRVLPTLIWYPAPAGSDPDEAPVDTSAAPHPLLLFSHGSCGFPGQSTFLTTVLASYGFIVAAPPHPGNTLAEFPACGTPAAQIASFVERPQDMLHVLNELLAANQDPNSPFFGTIDGTRLGMSGHSFGGLTTFLTVALDSRFKVAVPMAAAAPSGGAFTIPSLTMIGEVDSVVNNTLNRDAYTASTPPKFLVGIKHAGHYAFSNGCFPSPDCMPPVTLTQAEAHDLVLRWLLPFLEVHLAGDAGFAPFLVPPAPPTVVFEASP